MRTSEEISSSFTTERIRELTETLIEPYFTDNEKLDAAMKFLHIDPNQFNYIPFKADKVNFLQYRYILTHFELYKPNFDVQYWDCLDKLDGLTAIAKDVILYSPVITDHKDLYCDAANGLKFIFQRTGKVSRMDEKETKDYSASIMQTGKKPGGVEPGFMAVHQQDLIQILIRNCHVENVRDFVHIYEGNIEHVYNHFAAEMPKYMYKLDYHTDDTTLENPGYTPVYLTDDDVKRTNTIKGFYNTNPSLGYIAAKIVVMAKKSTSGVINEDAVLETLANDLVSTIMQVQNQMLFKSEYQNMDLKIMACCEWVKNAMPYGKEDSPVKKEKASKVTKPLCEKKNIPLFGGLSDSDNYRVRHLMVPQNGITAVNDSRILNASQYYLPLLFTGDYDKIGSKGQNMLVVPHARDTKTGLQQFDLVGIDFGHTLKEKNRLIADMTTDGRFTQPSKNPFKNFIALSDGSLSEKMQGILLLSKLQGYEIPKRIIASYGDAFYFKYQTLPANVSNILCDNYIQAFEQLCITDESHANMYEKLIETIRTYKMRMNVDLNAFITKFEPYLQLEASEVDLIDNFNKYSASVLKKTKLTSNNTQVGLHHLCIDLSYKESWTIAFDAGNQCYTCKYTGQDKGVNAQLEQAFNNKVRGIAQIKNNVLQLSFHKNNFAKIQTDFLEDIIKKHFHKAEYKAIKKAKIDIQLQDLMRAPWFKEHNIELSLKAHPTKPMHYVLNISFDQAPSNVRAIIKHYFGNLNVTNEAFKIQYDFDSNSLKQVHSLLTKIQNQYEIQLTKPHKTIEMISASGFFSNSTTEPSKINTNSNKEENPVLTFRTSIELICAIIVGARSIEPNHNGILSSIYTSTSSFYNSRNNPTSSAALLSKLKNYLEKCNPEKPQEYSTLFDDVLTALHNRLSYVEAQLLPNASDSMKATYREELDFLTAAILVGDKIELAESKLDMMSKAYTS